MSWVVALLAAAATMYWTVVPKLIRDLWEDPNYSHGLLVPFFSAYLVWQHRDDLSLFPEGGGRRKGAVLLLASVLFLIVGKAGGELFTTRISLVLMVAAFTHIFYGDAGFRVCRFPLLFLLFMVPIPYIAYDAASLPLKLLSSRIAEAMMSLIGIPVFREGNVFTLPDLRMEVVEACSGMRSLLSLLAIATVAGYYAALSLPWWFLLLLLVFPVTIVLNSFRLFMTGILSTWVGPGAAEGFLHDFSGWVVFMAGAVVMGTIALLLKKVSRRDKGGTEAPGRAS